MTTDESPQLTPTEQHQLQVEETKANCPDEYNLLSGSASMDNLESVEALKNTSPDTTVNQNHQNNNLEAQK